MQNSEGFEMEASNTAVKREKQTKRSCKICGKLEKQVAIVQSRVHLLLIQHSWMLTMHSPVVGEYFIQRSE